MGSGPAYSPLRERRFCFTFSTLIDPTSSILGYPENEPGRTVRTFACAGCGCQVVSRRCLPALYYQFLSRCGEQYEGVLSLVGI